MPEKLRYLTSGESHGKALLCIIDGICSGLSISKEDINKDLLRRQKGYGRGGRMKIESDSVQILSGVRWGKTIGSPIALLIENKDWQNWKDVMSVELRVKSLELTNSRLQTPDSRLSVTRPRPGHADLAGAIKYNTHDIRNILERSSARETAARVAVGAVAKKFLSEFNIKVISYVTEIGGIKVQSSKFKVQSSEEKLLEVFEKAETSPVRCPDKNAEKKIINKINTAIKKGDSLGGIFEVVVTGVPVGLGSYSQWDRRLNARLACALTGIQAIKGVEIGLGFEMSGKFGSEVMDEIFYRAQSTDNPPISPLTKGGIKEGFTKGGMGGFGFYRKTNNAGGIEGGISNGMPIVLRAAMKPIPTLRTPLSSVDIISKKSFKAAYERSDVCAVPAASVVGEAVVAFVIADSFLEKFGGDSMDEIKRNYVGYLKQVRKF